MYVDPTFQDENMRWFILFLDPSANYADEQPEKDQTQLQLCIKTKWNNAIVIYADDSELFLV